MTDKTVASDGLLSGGNTAAQTDSQVNGDTNVKTDTKADGKGLLEGQDNGGASKDGEKGPTDGTSKTVVPEKYEDFKMPEGIKLNETMATEFKGVAKELGLTQEQAQKLVDMQTKGLIDSSNQLKEDHSKLVDEWKTESVASMGGNIKQEIFKAESALKEFGTPEFKEFLISTGLQNHPGFLSFLRNVGGSIVEDGQSDGQSRPPRKSDAEVFYPDMKV
jgi:hypothetical protein